MRTEIESKLHLNAIDIYGLSEVLGPGVSVECLEAKNGLHIFEDHFIPEIIDPITGETLQTALKANWCLPRSPKRLSRSSAIEHGT